mgnify:CR=1 FL=1
MFSHTGSFHVSCSLTTEKELVEIKEFGMKKSKEVRKDLDKFLKSQGLIDCNTTNYLKLKQLK